jgi:hypothetical protein
MADDQIMNENRYTPPPVPAHPACPTYLDGPAFALVPGQCAPPAPSNPACPTYVERGIVSWPSASVFVVCVLMWVAGVLYTVWPK